MKFIYVLAACLFLSGLADGRQTKSLYSVKQNGQCGYIDNVGNIVIKPRFDTCWNFSEGLAGVVVGGKLGFIDEAGRYVAQPFYNYDLVGFSEGFANVSVGEYYKDTRQVGVIDRKGQAVFLPSVTSLWDFSEGLAVFEKGGRRGFIDRDLNVVIEPKYTYAYSFADGLAQVEDENGVSYYIDKSGKKAIDRDGASFSEGLASFEVKNKYTGSKHGFFNTKGEIVIEPQFSYVEFFYEGLCAARDWETDKWGFIDKTGKFVIKPQFDDAERFAEGFGQVSTGDKWGFVNRAGEIVIPIEFEAVDDFTGGIAAVKIDDDWSYIDKSGKYVWK